MDTYSYADTPPMPMATQVLWLVSGDAPGSKSAAQVAARCNSKMRQPHLVWDPTTGDTEVMTPGDRETNLYPPNHPGRRMYTVMAVADKDTDLSAYPQGPMSLVLYFLNIPDAWPLGPPTGARTRRETHTAPGHYTSDQLDSRYGTVGTMDHRKLSRRNT